MKNKKCPVTGGGARPFEFYQRLQQFTDVNQPILFPCWVERSIGSHLQFFAVTLSRQYPQKTICKWSGQRQLLLLAVINRVHRSLATLWNNTFLTFGQFYHMHFYFWLKWQTLVWQSNLPSHRFLSQNSILTSLALSYHIQSIDCCIFVCLFFNYTNKQYLLVIESYTQTIFACY